MSDLFAGTAHAPTLVVNVTKGQCSVYCGRAMPAKGYPDASPWANPFKLKQGHTDEERRAAIRNYEATLMDNPTMILRIHQLRGHALGCWCAPKPCHCDVLARWANGSSRALLEAHFKARRSFGRHTRQGSEKPLGEADWLEWLKHHKALPAELKSWRHLEEDLARPALEFLVRVHEPAQASVGKATLGLVPPAGLA